MLERSYLHCLSQPKYGDAAMLMHVVASTCVRASVYSIVPAAMHDIHAVLLLRVIMRNVRLVGGAPHTKDMKLCCPKNPPILWCLPKERGRKEHAARVVVVWYLYSFLSMSGMKGCSSHFSVQDSFMILSAALNSCCASCSASPMPSAASVKSSGWST